MSYARFISSDVYVFLSSRGIECCGCALMPSEMVYSTFFKELVPSMESFVADSTDEMLEHLEKHTTAGHFVEEECIIDLKRDKEENDKYLSLSDAERKDFKFSSTSLANE